MISDFQETGKKAGTFLMILMLALTLTMGCASRSRTTTTVDGGGHTVQETTTTTTSDEGRHYGVIGGAFHVIGEIIAFPFEVIAGVFRLIF